MTEALRQIISEADALSHAIPPPLGALSVEQLVDTRHELVRLHRALDPERHDDMHFPFVEEVSTLTPEDAEARIAAEHTAGSPLAEEYDRYVADLAAVRAEQEAYVTAAVEALPTTASEQEKRATYLEALQHSPALARRALEHVSAVSRITWRGAFAPELFTADQIDTASKDKATFQQALTQALMRQPEVVLGAHRVLERVAQPDEIRRALEPLQYTHPAALVENLGVVQQYYPDPAEFKQVVTTAANGNTQATLSKVLQSELACSVLGEVEVQQVAQKALAAYSLPDAATIAKCVELGYITPEAVQERVQQLVANSGAIREIPAGLLDNTSLFTPDERQQVKAQVAEHFLSGHIADFPSILFNKVLSRSEVEQVVMQRFAVDPLGVSDQPVLQQIVEAHVPPEQLRSILRDNLWDNPRGEGYRYAFTNPSLTPEDKRAYAALLVEEAPGNLLVARKYLNDSQDGDPLFSPPEMSQLMSEVVHKAPFEQVSEYLRDGVLDYVGDKAAQRQFILEKLAEEPTMVLFSADKQHIINGLFEDSAQVADLMHQTLDRILTSDMPLDTEAIQGLVWRFDEQTGHAVMEQVARLRPALCLSALPQLRGYDSGQAQQLLVGMCETAQGRYALVNDLLESTYAISSKLPADKIEFLIDQLDPKQTMDVFINSNLVARHMSNETLQAALQRLIAQNPAMAILCREFYENRLAGGSLDEALIIQNALKDKTYMSIAGKHLTTTLERIKDTGIRKSERERLLWDLSTTYQTLATINNAGGLEDLQPLHNSLKLNAAAEMELLEVYGAISQLGTSQDSMEVRSFTTREQLDSLAVEVTARALGLTDPITEEQKARLLQSMGSITPISLYVAQFAGSGRHAEVLRPMYQSLLDGNYQQWKYGPPILENLQELQQAHFLPSLLTLEQYDEWQKDMTTTFGEVFEVQPASVADQVRQILGANETDLPEGSLVTAEARAATLAKVSEELADVGSTIGEIYQELKALRDLPNQELSGMQIQMLSDELIDITQVRNKLQLKQDVIRLYHMTGEEVQTGMLAPAAAGGKGRPIAQALQTLRKGLDANATFLAEQIDATFASYKEQASEAQTVSVTDTADPRITIEIGKRPIDSCQNYRNGVYNEALIGYTDANTKILFVTNERGNPVARSIFRLLGDASGRPYVHAETVYSANASDSVVRAVNAHAIGKAGTMGVPFEVSAYSQNAAGAMLPTRQVAGYRYEPTSHNLISSNSRAPTVYVDSRGGKQQRGMYTINHTVRPVPVAT